MSLRRDDGARRRARRASRARPRWEAERAEWSAGENTGRCRKRGYSQAGAEAEVAYHALMREHGLAFFRATRTYDCPNCPRWHVTSEPPYSPAESHD